LCDSDGRDVYFQSNPFEQVKKEGVYAWYEPAPLRSDTSFNQAWIRDWYVLLLRNTLATPFVNACLLFSYGQAYLDELLERDENVVCCGVTMGTAAALRAYMSFYVNEMDTMLKQREPGNNDWCIHGMDTAAHYRTMYTHLPRVGVPALILDDKTSFVRHRGQTAVNPDAPLDPQVGQLANSPKEIPWAVVHQADRDELFWAAAKSRYSPSYRRSKALGRG
jgi:hypothetical protein